MKSRFCKLVIAILFVGLIVDCGGSGGVGGGFAGVGGSGFISSGQVTGFGSVFVNGVKFETEHTLFNIEGVEASQHDLRIGMVVQVAGNVNADGITGTATSIRYADILEGPVELIPGADEIAHNEAHTEKLFNVMGITVLVDVVNTTFEGEKFNFDDIDLGDVVEVSGYYDNNAVLRATYIELKAKKFYPTTVVEIEGHIAGLNDTRFNIQGVNIDYSTNQNSVLAVDLKNDLYVEVKGNYDMDSATLFATEVNAVEIELSGNSEVTMQGYVTRFVSNSDFDINGYTVNASSAVLKPGNLIIRPGLKLEAKGELFAGTLNATEIVFDEGDARIKAFIDSIDVANRQFTVEVVTGEPSVTIQLTDITIIENRIGEVNLLSLSDLNLGDYIVITGFESDIDTVSAIIVRRKLFGSIELRGVLRAYDPDVSVTVLGVAFPVSAGATEFAAKDRSYVNHAAFILDTTIDETVISIEDEWNNGFGIADEVEIKNK